MWRPLESRDQKFFPSQVVIAGLEKAKNRIPTLFNMKNKYIDLSKLPIPEGCESLVFKKRSQRNRKAGLRGLKRP